MPVLRKRPAQADQAVPAKPAPICAESPAQLAKDAGLSPAELQVIQALGTRRGELDSREQGLDTQLALIQAAEQKVDARIATMNSLKGDIQGLLGQLDDKQQAEVDRLVKVYEAMKPADSAARFVLLTDEVRLPIAAKMKERALSAMIAKMSPPEAKRLTESLAARYIAQAAAAKQAINPPPAQPATQAARRRLGVEAAGPARASQSGGDSGRRRPRRPAAQGQAGRTASRTSRSRQARRPPPAAPRRRPAPNRRPPPPRPRQPPAATAQACRPGRQAAPIRARRARPSPPRPSRSPA